MPVLPFNFCHWQASTGSSGTFEVEEDFLLDGLTITIGIIRSYLGVSVVILLCIKWKLEGMQHSIPYCHT
jgi:hypothetical protein